MRTRVASIAGAFLSLTLLAAASLAAQGATASICKDGTKSAVSGRGACSGHGGVDAKATAAAKNAAKPATKTAAKPAAKSESAPPKAPAAAGKPAAKPPAAPAAKANANEKSAVAKGENDATNATAQCKDGTYSHAKTHQGACSRHGGVAKFLK